MLGMGARDAIVRLTPLRPPTRRIEPQTPPASPDVTEEAAEASLPPEEVEEDTAPASVTAPAAPADIAPPTPTPSQAEQEAEREPQPAPEPVLRTPVEADGELEREARIARETLLELLEHRVLRQMSTFTMPNPHHTRRTRPDSGRARQRSRHSYRSAR